MTQDDEKFSLNPCLQHPVYDPLHLSQRLSTINSSVIHTHTGGTYFAYIFNYIFLIFIIFFPFRSMHEHSSVSRPSHTLSFLSLPFFFFLWLYPPSLPKFSPLILSPHISLPPSFFLLNTTYFASSPASSIICTDYKFLYISKLD